jgi:hypothetical protein
LATALLELGFSADHLLTEMLFVTTILAVLSAQSADRAPPAVVAALRAGASCVSTVSVTNLSGRELAAEIQARLDTGALAPLELVEPASEAQARSEPRGEPADAAIDRSGRPSIAVAAENLMFAPHERRSFRLGGQGETGNAWVGVWESDPPGTLPALAVEGRIECLAGDELRAVPRSAALALRNPWFAGEVADLAGVVMAVVNASAQAARADLCYSTGNLYFVPAEMPDGRLARLCSWSEEVAIPPFGSREFHVEREGANEFALDTRGESIVLLLLRPVAAGLRVYRVDSSIRFGGEVPPARPGR